MLNFIHLDKSYQNHNIKRNEIKLRRTIKKNSNILQTKQT